MEYKDRIAAIKAAAKYNPNLTDRELSIMLDAAFSEEEEDKKED